MKSDNPPNKLSEKAIHKQLTRFEKFFRPYKEKLTEYYGEDFAMKVRADTYDEFEKILSETPVFPGRMNIFNMVIGLNAKIVSFHKAMRANGKTVAETGRILFEVAEHDHNAIPKPVRWITRKFMFSPLFLMLIRSSAKNVRDHPEGWKIDYQKGDGTVSDWHFDCKECGVIKYFKRHDVEELGQYCNYVDYIQSKVFGLGLQNPMNIGQGDNNCTEYFKQGRETVIPDNLKDIASVG
jgi:hypothetical protein